MLAILNHWRYYALGKEEYSKCMEKTFAGNLHNLRQTNAAVALLACLFAFFPLFFERDFTTAGIHFACAAIALILCLFANRKNSKQKDGKAVTKRCVHSQIILYFTNVILLGIYLGVWASPGIPAVSFMVILICALLLFNTSPLFNMLLILIAIAAFIAASTMVKSTQNWSLDLVNSLFAGSISLFLSWKLTVHRMSLASNENKLVNERNDYYNQSTIDELTQLKNRRDFTQTFQRFLFNYRQSDNYICVAILDIDFFKNYNDHYGHLMGDDCLRALGKVLNSVKETMGIYTARVGGEEFALIWFEKEIEEATAIAARINQMIRDLKIPHEKSAAAPYVTVSIGIHVAKCGAFNNTQVLYDLADKALYAAKSAGRDRTVITT